MHGNNKRSCSTLVFKDGALYLQEVVICSKNPKEVKSTVVSLTKEREKHTGEKKKTIISIAIELYECLCAARELKSCNGKTQDKP